MKYLIIPDVHNRVDWVETLISRLGWEGAGSTDRQTIFLGDYFDSYHDTPAMAKTTAEWLRWSVNKGRIHLMGNHDLPYRWTKHLFPCPGHTVEKHRAVSGSGGSGPMGKSEWNELRAALILAPKHPAARPVVLSHAGFTLANLYGVGDFRDVASNGRCAHLRERLPSEHLDQIRKDAGRCVEMANNGQFHFWMNRGTLVGDHDVGGPFWIDRHQLHSQLPGIDQIVGHTHVRTPQRHCSPHQAAPVSEVWFIDGAGRYAAILDTSVVTPTGGYQVTPIHAQGERIGEPCAL